MRPQDATLVRRAGAKTGDDAEEDNIRIGDLWINPDDAADHSKPDMGVVSTFIRTAVSTWCTRTVSSTVR